MSLRHRKLLPVSPADLNGLPQHARSRLFLGFITATCVQLADYVCAHGWSDEAVRRAESVGTQLLDEFGCGEYAICRFGRWTGRHSVGWVRR